MFHEYLPGRKVRCVVTGISGFIGSHLGAELRRQGHYVVGSDWNFPGPDGIPLEESCDEFYLLDLRSYDNCRKLFAFPLADDEQLHVFHLAADMGGMGFIQSNHGACIMNNTLIDMHMLEASRVAGVDLFFYASSACAYPEHLQLDHHARGLRESQAWPAKPQDAYGLEKLYAEEACRHYARDFGLCVRIARFHNVYGPRGTWKGGREKAPAALCRKVAACEPGDGLELWGDGQQTRSFVFVDDLVEGVLRLCACTNPKVQAAPVNLGTEDLISVNDLADMLMRISGKRLRKTHDLRGPQGVRGRNSDNDLMREVLGWQPATPLAAGMCKLYSWVSDQVACELPEDRAALRHSVVTPTTVPKPLAT